MSLYGTCACDKMSRAHWVSTSYNDRCENWTFFRLLGVGYYGVAALIKGRFVQ